MDGGSAGLVSLPYLILLFVLLVNNIKLIYILSSPLPASLQEYFLLYLSTYRADTSAASHISTSMQQLSMLMVRITYDTFFLNIHGMHLNGCKLTAVASLCPFMCIFCVYSTLFLQQR